MILYSNDNDDDDDDDDDSNMWEYHASVYDDDSNYVIPGN